MKPAMPKFATNVILHGSGSVSNNTVKPSPKTDLASLKARNSGEKGSPSPKSSGAASRLHQRKSPHIFQEHNNSERAPHLGRPEEHTPWLSLSQQENYDSFDAEQQSHLSVVVLQPEHHRQFRQLIENQKLQSGTSASAVLQPGTHASFGSAASLRALRKPAPGEATMDTSVEDNHANTSHLSGIQGHTESVDEAMSDRTQPVEYGSGLVNANVSTNVEQLSMSEILAMQNLLQRELERRIVQAHQSGELPVDLAAVENRRNLRRSKSGGNESAFVKTPAGGNAPPSQRSSKLAAALSEHDNDDPELLLAYGGHGQPVMARPGSRASGALHPHDKMFLPNHIRSTSALSCLSPAQQLHMGSSPVDNNYGGYSSHGSSRPSSRPPSRGPFGGSHGLSSSHNGYLLASLVPVDPNNGEGAIATGSPAVIGVVHEDHAGPETVAATSAEGLEPFSALPPAISATAVQQQRTVAAGRHHSLPPSSSSSQRGELVLSPCSAFDDISLGSASLSSSLSSKAQRRRRREQSQQGVAYEKNQLPESITISRPINKAVNGSVKR
jgi:hypothetical protein